MNQSDEYYTPEVLEKINASKDFSEAVEIAIDILKRMPQPIAQVCGPITTGGKGSIKENTEVIENTVKKLSNQGITICNQTKFNTPIIRFRTESKLNNIDSNALVLEKFHKPILDSGLIKKFYFVHGWESSMGSRWERAQAKKLGIEIIDLPEDF